MKKIICIFLFSCLFGKSQVNKFINKNDKAIHFYTSCALNETFYNLHTELFKTKKVYKKFIFSNLLTFGFGLSKEIYDKNRCNKNKRTGFNKYDLYIDIWSLPCRISRDYLQAQHA